MNPQAIPSRISQGFLLLVLLLLLVGGIAVWRIHGVNGQVATLSANTVPSVVELGRVSHFAAASRRACSRVLQFEGSAPQRAAAEAAYRESKQAGEESCRRYASSLISDDEDSRRFNAALEARAGFHRKADALLEIVSANKSSDPAKASDEERWLLEEVDPALEEFIKKLKDSIDYNVNLSEKASRGAERIANTGYWVIAIALLLATLAGLAIGWSTVRSAQAALDSINAAIQAGIDATNRALAGISDSIQQGADQTASSAGQLSAASRSLASSRSRR
jgi:CHASE3 domain sensor protein